MSLKMQQKFAKSQMLILHFKLCNITTPPVRAQLLLIALNLRPITFIVHFLVMIAQIDNMKYVGQQIFSIPVST